MRPTSTEVCVPSLASGCSTSHRRLHRGAVPRCCSARFAACRTGRSGCRRRSAELLERDDLLRQTRPTVRLDTTRTNLEWSWLDTFRGWRARRVRGRRPRVHLQRVCRRPRQRAEGRPDFRHQRRRGERSVRGVGDRRNAKRRERPGFDLDGARACARARVWSSSRRLGSTACSSAAPVRRAVCSTPARYRARRAGRFAGGSCGGTSEAARFALSPSAPRTWAPASR